VGKCFYCLKDKEVILDRRMKDSLPHEGVYNMEPCPECEALMAQGVILISVKPGSGSANPDRTGGWVVITAQAAERLFDDPQVLEKRVAFMEDDAWDKVGLPREGGQ